MCFVALVFLSNSSYYKVLGDPQVPCFFIFGDSLVDNGNNNGLVTFARANFLPHGIDFPKGPTGRFSNGKTIAHVISKIPFFLASLLIICSFIAYVTLYILRYVNSLAADLLGFDDYIQSYANASGPEILRGVNYASAGAGIRDEAGQHAVCFYLIFYL